MLHLSTHEFAGGSRLARWSEIVAEVFTPLEITARRPDQFDASVDAVELGQVRLANVVASPAKVHRTARDAAVSRMRHYFLYLQLEGELLVAQDGHDAHLREGDMALCDSALPYTLENRERCSTLVMIVEPTALKRRLPSPEIALGRKMSGADGLSAALSLSLAAVWRDVKRRERVEVAEVLSKNLLDLLATCCMDSFGARGVDSAVAASRRSHIRCHIESNLSDPELTVASIAKAFRISPRYLHMLFADEDETISGFIRRRRLEECRKKLSDPMWRQRSITELAYGWGFNNTTHFARVFREKYGVSPREFRNKTATDNELLH